ncbi:MAG: MFS transporter, partial [Deltaproteobacteria bacterium]|nr:MFS transporter [Deltaproteobacteria bacterium]
AHYRALGASGGVIGLLFALPSLAACILPLWIGHLADRRFRPLSVLRSLSLIAIAAMAGLAAANGLAASAAFALAASLALCSVPTLTDSLTLQAVGRSAARYGRVRSFGSLGYVAATASYALWSARAPWVATGLVGLILTFSLFARSEPSKVASEASLVEAARVLLGDRELRGMLLVFAAHWAAVGPYQSFLPLMVEDLGYSESVASVAFALAASAEILGMWIVRGSPVVWLSLTFVVSSIRWTLTGLATGPEILIASQALHVFSFGAFVVAAQKLVVARVPERLRSTGQGLFFSIVFGAGGGIGALASGHGYELIGGRGIFLAASIVELGALFGLIWVWSRSWVDRA